MAHRQVIPFDHFKDRGGLLSGVWFTTEQAHDDCSFGPDASQVCYFLLDGHIYRIQEDPEDGYRSHHGDIEVCLSLMPVNVWEPSEPVFIRHTIAIRDEDYPSEHVDADVLEFVSRITDKVILTLGTIYDDSRYYPCFTARFDCRSLSHNQGVVDLIGREQVSDKS